MIETKITFNMAKERIFQAIIDCEISSYTTLYAPDKTVVTISNLMKLTGLTKYGARKALRALMSEGLIYYTSQGCPAVISCGEVPELVYEAGPPINGYALTDNGFHSLQFQKSYKEWEKSMEEWADGKEEE